MSTPFQNRLVGTVIVAAAAIIFLPDIFDGEKQEYHAQFEQVPTGQKPVTQLTVKEFPEQDFATLEAQQTLDSDIALDDNEQLEIRPTVQAASTEVPAKLNKNQVAKTTPAEVKTSTSANKPATSEPLPEKVKPVVVVKRAVNQPKVVNVTPASVSKKQAYVIQLGSFKHRKNVEQLLSKLKTSGYTVFTKPINTAAGKLTKVFIGPEISEASLQAKLPKLKQLTGVQGRVAVFNPLD